MIQTSMRSELNLNYPDKQLKTRGILNCQQNAPSAAGASWSQTRSPEARSKVDLMAKPRHSREEAASSRGTGRTSSLPDFIFVSHLKAEVHKPASDLDLPIPSPQDLDAINATLTGRPSVSMPMRRS
jgi:hypothetical protein